MPHKLRPKVKSLLQEVIGPIGKQYTQKISEMNYEKFRFKKYFFKPPKNKKFLSSYLYYRPLEVLDDLYEINEIEDNGEVVPLYEFIEIESEDPDSFLDYLAKYA